MLAHLTSAASLRPKDDALLFAEIVQRTGGPDTFWAESVRDAMARDVGPLRDQHRAEMQRRINARERSIVEIVKRYSLARHSALPSAKTRLDRREKRELTGAYLKYGLESFVVWATRNKSKIEQDEEIRSLRHVRQIDDIARQDSRRFAPSRNHWFLEQRNTAPARFFAQCFAANERRFLRYPVSISTRLKRPLL